MGGWNSLPIFKILTLLNSSVKCTFLLLSIKFCLKDMMWHSKAIWTDLMHLSQCLLMCILSLILSIFLSWYPSFKSLQMSSPKCYTDSALISITSAISLLKYSFVTLALLTAPTFLIFSICFGFKSCWSQCCILTFKSQ